MRADNGRPGAAYDVVRPDDRLACRRTSVDGLAPGPVGPEIDTSVINPNVSSYVVAVVVPVSSVDEVTRPWSS